MNVVQLQAKAERQAMLEYRPGFAPDLDRLDRMAAREYGDAQVSAALGRPQKSLEDLAALLRAGDRLEEVAAAAHQATVRRFGKTMRMFAPVYLSNDCVSECTYCGFQVFNRDVVRKTLDVGEVAAEVRTLHDRGFRHVLLVAAEHPRKIGADYVARCIRAASAIVPQVSVEVQVWSAVEYSRFVAEGGDGLVVYQEVYDPRVYPRFHLKGNKRFWAWRLGAAERAADAGMRRIGIGTLLGLNPNWRWEVLALAAHARWLAARYWGVELTVALPRLEPAVGYERAEPGCCDRDFALALAALRLALPHAGIVLSTREPARLRDGLVRIGVTHMSAGSRTEPGGYADPGGAQEQFEVSDGRTPSQVAQMLRGAGYEPVWKDWA